MYGWTWATSGDNSSRRLTIKHKDRHKWHKNLTFTWHKKSSPVSLTHLFLDSINKRSFITWNARTFLVNCKIEVKVPQTHFSSGKNISKFHNFSGFLRLRSTPSQLTGMALSVSVSPSSSSSSSPSRRWIRLLSACEGPAATSSDGTDASLRCCR